MFRMILDGSVTVEEGVLTAKPVVTACAQMRLIKKVAGPTCSWPDRGLFHKSHDRLYFLKLTMLSPISRDLLTV